MSPAIRNRALHLPGEKERSGHPVRADRPATHQRRHGRAQGEVSGHFLSQTAPQQLEKTTRIRVPRSRHPPSHNSQQ